MGDSLPDPDLVSKSIVYNYWENKKIEEIFYTDKVFLEFLSLKISETRRFKGLTIEELAQKANVTPLQIQNIENRIGDVDIFTFEKVLQALDIRIKINISFDQ